MSDAKRADSGPVHGPQERTAGSPLRSREPATARAAPYPLSRLSAPISLVDCAREIERAEQWIASTASAKLEQIAIQMRALRQQAEQVLAQARADAELHRAEARFVRHAGQIYHLYERSDGQRYWSLLSPRDWADAPPHRFVGSYRLEADQSWTPSERLAERDREQPPRADWFKVSLLRADD